MKTFARIPRRRSGFTLLELLIVIAIIAILASVAFPVTALVITQAHKANARNEVVNIVRSVKAYDMEYSKMPLTTADAGADTYETETDQEFMAILLGTDDTAGGLNPRGKVFYNGKEAKEGLAGLDYGEEGNTSGSKPRLVDPWGKMYFVAIDADYDHKLQGPSECGSGDIHEDVIAWSKGPPKDETGELFDDCKKWPKSF